MQRMLAALLLFSCASSAPAQLSVPEGFGMGRYAGAPATAFVGGMDVSPTGSLVVYDGSAVVEVERTTGTVLRTLFTPPPATFGSFIRTDRGRSRVFFGESSTGTIFAISWPSGVATPFANLGFNYDMAIDPSGEIYVTANPAFAGCEIHHVDAVSGATDLIANLSGPSGPIAFDASGNLYYATQSPSFPAPAGSTDIITFSAAQLQSAQGPGALVQAQSTLYAAALDGGFAADFAGDGELYVSDANTGRVVQVSPGGAKSDFLVEASQVFTFLAFDRGTTPYFRPYAPASSGRLLALATDFCCTNDVVETWCARPEMTQIVANPVPAGSVPLLVDGAPANGMAIYILTLGAPTPSETFLFLPNPLAVGVDLTGFLTAVTFPVDALGGSSISLMNPGGFPGISISTQAILFDAALNVIGSTNVTETISG